MNDFSKLFADMMEQGQKMAQAFNPGLENFSAQGFDKLWPTMPREMMEMLWGNSVNKDGLDAKTRLLVVLAGLTVLGAQAEPVFKATVRHAVEAGARKQEVADVIYQMSMLGGLPAMGRAMQMAEAVFAEAEGDKA